VLGTSPASRPSAASLSSQDSPETAAFEKHLQNYRTSSAREVIGELATWPVDRLVAAAKASTPILSPSNRMAAAILEAEVAGALLVPPKPNGAAAGIFQTDAVLKVINSALVLLHEAGPDPFGEQLGEDPRRSWYYATASVLVVAMRLSEASKLVETGLTEFPNDPLLITARGTISHRHLDALMFRQWPGVRTGESRQTQTAATADYKRALTLSPHLALASLRLGQLYVDLGNEREARPLLQSVGGSSATDNQQYFAHLLLGRMAANDREFEASATEYEKAYGIAPGYQTACIALSRIEEVLERQGRAAAIAEDCFRLSGHDDPWPHYRAQGDPDALLRLRAEARGR
jgi:hypothetical protein